MTVLDQEFFNPCHAHESELASFVVEAMRTSAVYPVVTEVAHYETHISHIFLVGKFAYKIKKPIKTSFLDFTTLEKRHHYCDEEFRLDQRYAKDLYIGVVPITMNNGSVCVEGCGEPIEYAVKMHRFPDDALLSHCITAGQVTTSDVHRLAASIASFHAAAQHCDKVQALRVPELLFANLREIIEGLKKNASASIDAALDELRRWSESYLAMHRNAFVARSQNGYVRECHGDLHSENIVHWKGELIPFDGIEFNDAFRWIDVMNDAAFLSMDLAVRGRLDLSRLFIDSYLESTGDHASLVVLRWYLVYRSLIRAMVAKMKAEQHENEQELYQVAIRDCQEHIQLASHFTLCESPTLYITHGLSGSGKTTASEVVVAQRGAIRLRSDVERKRHFGISVDDHVNEKLRHKIYCESANIATYNRLERLASGILQDGYSVVIDATFLRHSDRERFRRFAENEDVPFAILDCHADAQTLRQRIADRIALGDDASDADLDVLDLQLASQQPLTAMELTQVISIENLVATNVRP